MNVRELHQALSLAVVLAGAEAVIDAPHLPAAVRSAETTAPLDRDPPASEDGPDEDTQLPAGPPRHCLGRGAHEPLGRLRHLPA